MKRYEKEKGRKQKTAILAEINGSWLIVDKVIEGGEIPIFVGIGSGFDILRWIVWTDVSYGRKASVENTDMGDIIGLVAERLGQEDDENLEVRVYAIPRHLVRGRNLHDTTNETRDWGVYVPTRNLYGPRLPADHRIDPK